VTLSRRWMWPLLLTGAMAGGACSSILSAGQLRMTASAVDAVASPADPAAVRVTATNVGDARVTWGPGSSTCWFNLYVRVDGTDLFASAFNGRICTGDSRTFSLDPGESRTETLEWTGLAQRGNSVVPLDPGTYEVRASARDAANRPVATSEPIMIEVRPNQ
jgi:hypothetical protein